MRAVRTVLMDVHMNSSVSAERFERARPVLLRHAYRMLGEYADAEDVVQDAFVRRARAAETTPVLDDQAFLRTVELADDLSFALLLALERLDPLERAAFLLHDALGVPFAEVAHTLDRSEEAVRKLASRARTRVRDAHRAPRIPRDAAARLRDRFLEALQRDDIGALQDLLLADVVLTSDGGGKVPAAAVPVVGSDNVSRFFISVARKGAAELRRTELTHINGLPGVVLFDSKGVTIALAFEAAGDRIGAIYAVRNPDKLARLAGHFSAGVFSGM